jgi:SAM-dependent methyltransferase
LQHPVLKKAGCFADECLLLMSETIAMDESTQRFYQENASVYVSRKHEPDERLRAFLNRLPARAKILELGCGGGLESQVMLEAGFDVTPTDGIAHMAQEAQKRLGVLVRVMPFADLDDHALYDAIWANACLLHAPRDGLPVIFKKIYRALKPSGLFEASFKSGNGEGRDQFGRYYNYPSPDWLREKLKEQNWKEVQIESGFGSGYDNLPTKWLYVQCRKA